jgi:hypothetical protein
VGSNPTLSATTPVVPTRPGFRLRAPTPASRLKFESHPLRQKLDESCLEVARSRAALLQIPLMIFFRSIKSPRRRNFRCNRPPKFSARFQRSL